MNAVVTDSRAVVGRRSRRGSVCRDVLVPAPDDERASSWCLIAPAWLPHPSKATMAGVPGGLTECAGRSSAGTRDQSI